MTYTALAILFMLVSAGVGAWGSARVAQPWVAAGLAAAMVVAQFAVLASR